jgi:hypothetical protein
MTRPSHMPPICSLPERSSARQRTRLPRAHNHRGTWMLFAAGRTAVHIDASQRKQKSDGDHDVRERQHPAPPPPSALRLPAREPPRDGAQPPQPGWYGSRQLFPARSRFILGKPREDREHRRQPGLARAQGFSNSFQGSLLCCWQAQSRTPSARSCAIRSYPAPEAQTCGQGRGRDDRQPVSG